MDYPTEQDDWEPNVEEEWKPPTEAEMKVLQAKRERSDKISKLMGDYLLKGYKMLASSCSKCSTILLQSKQGVNYCVACSELDSDTVKDDPALSCNAARRQAAEQEERSIEENTHTQARSKNYSNLGNSKPLADLGTPNIINGLSTAQVIQPWQLHQSSQSNNQASGILYRPCPEETRQINSYTSDEPQLGQPNSLFSQQHSSWDLGVGTSSKRGVSVVLNSPIALHNGNIANVKQSQQNSDNDDGAIGYSIATNTTRKSNVEAVEQKLSWATDELQKCNSVEYSIQLCQLIKSCAEALSALNKV